MNTRPILPILATVIVLAGSHRATAVEMDIDCGVTIVRRPVALRYGVDVNYLIDSDRYDPARKIKFRQSLKDLNVKAIRWNEGEIGDKTIWAKADGGDFEIASHAAVGPDSGDPTERVAKC